MFPEAPGTEKTAGQGTEPEGRLHGYCDICRRDNAPIGYSCQYWLQKSSWSMSGGTRFTTTERFDDATISICNECLDKDVASGVRVRRVVLFVVLALAFFLGGALLSGHFRLFGDPPSVPLDVLLDTRGPFPEFEAISITRQIAGTLQDVRVRGLVHGPRPGQAPLPADRRANAPDRAEHASTPQNSEISL